MFHPEPPDPLAQERVVAGVLQWGVDLCASNEAIDDFLRAHLDILKELRARAPQLWDGLADHTKRRRVVLWQNAEQGDQ